MDDLMIDEATESDLLRATRKALAHLNESYWAGADEVGGMLLNAILAEEKRASYKAVREQAFLAVVEALRRARKDGVYRALTLQVMNEMDDALSLVDALGHWHRGNQRLNSLSS